MYSTCLHCHHRLGRNDAIEHFPVGRRLAFDAAKGRLWAVCPHCARWNLTPIEERWEAVEDAERLFRSTRLRAQTDNVGLVRLPEGTDLIRIGAPLRPEFAAWRYGAVFRRRRNRRVAFTAAGGVIVGVGVALGGVSTAVAQLVAAPFFAPVLLNVGFQLMVLRARFQHAFIIGDDGNRVLVTAKTLDDTHVTVQDDAIELDLPHVQARRKLTGERAVRALGSLLAAANRRGGSARTVNDAAALIAEAGDPVKTIARVARESVERAGDFDTLVVATARGPHGRTQAEAFRAKLEIDRRWLAFEKRSRELTGWSRAMARRNPGALDLLPPVSRLALEMSLHESSEQRALGAELATLERDWREAEEIAAIADGMLTPV